MSSLRRGLLLILLLPLSLPAQGSISLGVPLKELIKRAAADSNDPAAHYNVALGYWSEKKWPEAERALKTTLQLDPRFAEAHLAMAFFQIAANQSLMESTDEARKEAREKLLDYGDREYRHAFLINPKVDIRIMASVQRAADDYAMRAIFGPLFANYVTGITACQEGRYPRCEEMLTDVIDGVVGGEAPDAAYWHRGLAAAQQGKYDIAEKDFQKLLDHDLANAKKAQEKTLIRTPIRANEYRYFRAAFLHLKGDTLRAVDLYKQVLENDLGMYIAHVRLADIYEARRDYANALEERKRAINANPDDPTLQFEYGVTLAKAGKLPEAEAAFTQAVNGMPRNVQTHYWLGRVHQQQGKNAEARAAYEKVVALAPSRFKDLADQARTRIAALK